MPTRQRTIQPECEIDFPVCILAKELEKVAEQRQACSASPPRGVPSVAVGAQAVIHLTFDGGGPEGEFIGHRGRGWRTKKYRQSQCQRPEGHAAGRFHWCVVALLAFSPRQQRPHAACRTQGVQPRRRGTAPRLYRPAHRHDAGQRYQRSQPGRDPRLERLSAALFKNSAASAAITQRSSIVYSCLFFLIRKGTKKF